MAIALRPSQALRLWQQVALHEVETGMPDLSTRQLSILLTIYLDAPPHTVRGLAARLNVSKPVITRALDTMGALDLVSRRRDDADALHQQFTRRFGPTELIFARRAAGRAALLKAKSRWLASRFTQSCESRAVWD